jgi:hypothetical protein
VGNRELDIFIRPRNHRILDHHIDMREVLAPMLAQDIGDVLVRSELPDGRSELFFRFDVSRDHLADSRFDQEFDRCQGAAVETDTEDRDPLPFEPIAF